MNYWLHRISYYAEISYPLLEKGYLTIGFSDFSNQKFIEDVLKDDTWEKRWKVLENEFINVWGERPRTRHNLWRFIEGFKKGDKIVIPSWGTFYVYEIVSEKPQKIADLEEIDLKDWNGNNISTSENLLKKEDTIIDLGFFWKVKPIVKNISRYEFADRALTARMKIRNTNANISDIKDSVDKAIEAFKSNKPINLHSQLIETTVPNIINKIKSELNPDKFESIVKWYFERIGANDVYIPAKNESGKEGDADVVATFDQIRTIIYAQVKFHDGETNSWAVEQIKDYRNKKEENEQMDDDYTKISWVISSAESYSDESIRLAKVEKVQLINMNEFAKMLIEAGIYNLDKAL